MEKRQVSLAVTLTGARIGILGGFSGFMAEPEARALMSKIQTKVDAYAREGKQAKVHLSIGGKSCTVPLAEVEGVLAEMFSKSSAAKPGAEWGLDDPQTAPM